MTASRNPYHKGFLLAAVLWTVFVGILCGMPSPSLHSLPRIPHLDKVAHALLFGVLYLLWSRAVSRNTALIISVIYSVVTELYQEFMVPTRQGDLLDLAANFTGIGFVWFLLAKRGGV